INVQSLSIPLAIHARDGNDVINLAPDSKRLDVNILAPVTVHDGPGQDTLNLFDDNNAGDATFTIASGSITWGTFGGKVNFDYTQESIVLTTGFSNSTYHVNRNVNLPLRIVDSGLSDTLDYSDWMTGVTVDLLAGTATGLTGGVVGVENVLG